jgi:sec-independent protein translocase protein TatA
MIPLFLNSISGGEIIIILVFVLMFFGSKSIPGMARTLGRAMRQIRDATDDIKRDIRNSTGDLGKDFKELKEGVERTSRAVSGDMTREVDELKKMADTFRRTMSEEGDEKISNKRNPIDNKHSIKPQVEHLDPAKEEDSTHTLDSENKDPRSIPYSEVDEDVPAKEEKPDAEENANNHKQSDPEKPQENP